MKNFTNAHENEQYISIVITDGTEPAKVIEHIADLYPVVADNISYTDNDEILIDMPETGKSYPVSRLKLAEDVNTIAAAEVKVITIIDGERV